MKTISYNFFVFLLCFVVQSPLFRTLGLGNAIFGILFFLILIPLTKSILKRSIYFGVVIFSLLLLNQLFNPGYNFFINNIWIILSLVFFTNLNLKLQSYFLKYFVLFFIFSQFLGLFYYFNFSKPLFSVINFDGRTLGFYGFSFIYEASIFPRPCFIYDEPGTAAVFGCMIHYIYFIIMNKNNESNILNFLFVLALLITQSPFVLIYLLIYLYKSSIRYFTLIFLFLLFVVSVLNILIENPIDRFPFLSRLIFTGDTFYGDSRSGLIDQQVINFSKYFRLQGISCECVNFDPSCYKLFPYIEGTLLGHLMQFGIIPIIILFIFIFFIFRKFDFHFFLIFILIVLHRPFFSYLGYSSTFVFISIILTGYNRIRINYEN